MGVLTQDDRILTRVGPLTARFAKYVQFVAYHTCMWIFFVFFTLFFAHLVYRYVRTLT